MRFTNRTFDIEAWVEYTEVTDGSRLREIYQKTDQTWNGYKQSRAYLEMCEDKTFIIFVKIHKPVHRDFDLMFDLYIDGRDFRGTILSTSATDGNQFSRANVFIEKDGKQMMGRLRFARLTTTDEEADATIHGEQIGNLGSIVLEIQKGRAERHKTVATSNVTTVTDVGKVHEKRMKMGCTVSAADVKPIKFEGKTSFKPHHKVCSLVWKYYTRDMLVIKKIIAEEVRPAPLPRRSLRKRNRQSGGKATTLPAADDTVVPTPAAGEDMPAPQAAMMASGTEGVPAAGGAVQRLTVLDWGSLTGTTPADTDSSDAIPAAESSVAATKRKRNWLAPMTSAGSASRAAFARGPSEEVDSDSDSGSDGDGTSGKAPRRKKVKIVKMLDLTNDDEDGEEDN